MEQYEDQTSQPYQYKSHDSQNPTRERGGLIPITAHILDSAEVTKEETIEYQGVTISDITAVGYVVEYKELEAKIKLILYDYTGVIEVNFFNKQESQDSIGLSKFKFDGSRQPVQIFGTVKVYKNEKNIQGAKLIPTDSNFVLYHRANVIHSWLYLTGKLQEGKISDRYSGQVYYTSSKNDLEEAAKILDMFVRKEGKSIINEGKLYDLLKKFGSKEKDVINKLLGNNKIIENLGGYEIL